ncbi:MAG: helix-turn-helix transcriptional regulator [Patescibacteria group bacterium]
MKNGQSNHIGARIKIAREERGLSQLQLAEAVGFQSATAISLIESGERKVSSEILERLAEVLHRDTRYFLGQKENAPIDVRVALRTDKDLSKEDKDAILRFIDLAKSKKNGKRSS